jgi:hypothetical protein
MKRFARRSLVGAGTLAAAAGTLAFAVGATGASASGPVAQTARTVTFNDTGNLHKTGKKGFNLYESGSASGSISGSISLNLDVVSTNKVTAELTVHPKGGSISGKASGDYRTNGGTASFSGTMTITHGTGSYSGAHGSGISFSGTVQRANDSVTVHVTGKFSS